ncbi:MAG TPA: hypothetical protein VKE95_08540 [Burkholderiales bacterium]|nr:hypothetical protein [Burkholderiales bacterium]
MRAVALLLTATALAGCASEVVRSPAELSVAPSQDSRRYVVIKPASIMLDSGYERTINSGTEFIELGTIRQGRVFKPANTTFTIEGAHMHEAYPVVNGERIVGFYLPVERAFSPLSTPTSLFTQERKP